ncbi:MAG: thioredoxin fold domain-containing protein [Chloroherpetonaceae bacterium]|nr:thioredoxin fold domain-containing protein [Chthonomonadaceae bacterium]MDW8207540.1 thioredoxin fold domain-containing protein [Chloroherpetonaceae bacterium]
MFQWKATAAVVGAVVLALIPMGLSKASGEQKGTVTRTHGAIPWQKDFEQARKIAAKQNKLLMVDFYAEWCGACKMMLQTTYRDRQVVRRASDFVPLLVNVDVDEKQAKKRKTRSLSEQYQVEGIPTVIFMDARGRVIARAEGYLDAREFLQLMERAKNGRS